MLQLLVKNLTELSKSIKSPINDENMNIFFDALYSASPVDIWANRFYDELQKVGALTDNQTINEEDKKRLKQKLFERLKKSDPTATSLPASSNPFSDYIASRKLDGNTYDYKTDQRLYINCDFQDVYAIASKFIEKCEQHDLPFEFKFDTTERSKTRSDRMVFYSSNDNILEFFNILEEIAKENHDIKTRCGKPPIMTGVINEWIGIGAEPEQIKGTEQESFGTKMAKQVQTQARKLLAETVLDNKNENIDVNGEQVRFSKVVATTMIDETLNQLGRKLDGRIKEYGDKSGKEEFYNSYGLYAGDLISKEIKNRIIQALRERTDFLDNAFTNINAHASKLKLEIQTRDGKSFAINNEQVSRTLHTLIPTIRSIDPTLNTQLTNRLKTVLSADSSIIQDFQQHNNASNKN